MEDILGTPLQAIAFAIEQDLDAAAFLTDWSEGDVSEWPEYQEFREREHD